MPLKCPYFKRNFYNFLNNVILFSLCTCTNFFSKQIHQGQLEEWGLHIYVTKYQTNNGMAYF